MSVAEVKQRVADEFEDLVLKRNRLHKFMYCDKFSELTKEHQMLLHAQYGAMSAYENILSLRIDAFDQEA